VTGFLLDTNVLSELRRPGPNPGVLLFFREHPLETLFTSDVTLAEIRFGMETAASPLLRLTISEWLETVIRPLFPDRVLAATEDVWVRWRLLMAEGRRAGYTYPQPDLVLAAIAAHHGLTVVTRDTEPFRRAGVEVIDPWLAA
jgi:predicted nucleic acid-binding protein